MEPEKDKSVKVANVPDSLLSISHDELESEQRADLSLRPLPDTALSTEEGRSAASGYLI